MLRYVKADLGLEGNPGGADPPAQAKFPAGTRRFDYSGRRRARQAARREEPAFGFFERSFCGLEWPLRFGILTDPLWPATLH